MFGRQDYRLARHVAYARCFDEWPSEVPDGIALGIYARLICRRHCTCLSTSLRIVLGKLFVGLQKQLG